MKTGLRVVVVLLLGVALVEGLVRFALPDAWLVEEVASGLARNTGWSLSVRGPVSKSLLPRPRVSAESLRLLAPDGRNELLIGALEADLELGGLFAGRVGLSSTRVYGLKARITMPEEVPALGAAVASRADPSDEPSSVPALPRPEVAIAAVAVMPARQSATSPAPVELGELRIENGLVRVEGPEAVTELRLPSTLLSAADADGVRQLSASMRWGMLPIEIGARLAPSEQGVRIDALDLDADGLAIAGQLFLRAGQVPVQLEGHLTLRHADIGAWLATHTKLVLPARLARVDTDVALADGSVRLSKLSMRLDDSELRGDAEILLDPHGSLSLAGRVDQLDLGPWLSPGKGPSGGAVPARSAQVGDLPVPRLLPPVSGQHRVDLVVAALRHGRVAFGVTELTLIADGTRMRLKHLSPAFYGGALSGEMLREQSDGGPLWQIDQHAAAVELGPLLEAAGSAIPLAGSADLDLTLNGTAATLQELSRRGRGNAKVAVSRGRVTGLDLDALFGRSRERRADGGLPFQRFSANVRLVDGDLESDDLALIADGLRVDGSGRFRGLDQQLALGLQAVFTEPPAGLDLQELVGIPIPISANGHVNALAWRAELTGPLAEAARRTARRKVKENEGVIDEIERRTGIKGLGKGLKSLFGL